MHVTRWLWSCWVVGLLSGCTTVTPTRLTPEGSQVLPLAADPGPACTNLGTVIGSGPGEDTPSRVHSAFNDAKNKAVERGATHVFISALAFGRVQYVQGTVTTNVQGAVMTTIAYSCPKGVVSASLSDSPAPYTGPKSFLSTCPAKEGESVRERALRCKALEH